MPSTSSRRSSCMLLLACFALTAEALTERQAERVGSEDSAFMEWFNSIGAKAHNVQVMQFEGMGRGVGATTKVKKYDPVLSVPLDYVMCRQTALKTDDQKVRVALGSIRDDTDVVAMLMMREMAMGKDSKWAPYLKVLPAQVSLPFFFSETELAALQHPGEVAKSRQTRAKYEAAYNMLKKSGALEKVMAGTKKKLRKRYNTLETYLWAVALIGSRALTMRGSKYLVPFSDMFNYEPDGNQRKHDNGAHFLRTHKLGSSSFDVFADRDCDKG